VHCTNALENCELLLLATYPYRSVFHAVCSSGRAVTQSAVTLCTLHSQIVHTGIASERISHSAALCVHDTAAVATGIGHAAIIERYDA
jgi:hypothetical protein